VVVLVPLTRGGDDPYMVNKERREKKRMCSVVV